MNVLCCATVMLTNFKLFTLACNQVQVSETDRVPQQLVGTSINLLNSVWRNLDRRIALACITGARRDGLNCTILLVSFLGLWVQLIKQ